MEKIKKRKKTVEFYKKAKENNFDRFYSYLRKRLISRFNVPKDILVQTEDEYSFRADINITLEYEDGINKNLELRIGFGKVRSLLEPPYIYNKLNVKIVTKYECILFNQIDSNEFIKLYVNYYHLNYMTKDLKNVYFTPLNYSGECIIKPFILVRNCWDNFIQLEKNMDDGKSKKEKKEWKAFAGLELDTSDQPHNNSLTPDIAEENERLNRVAERIDSRIRTQRENRHEEIETDLSRSST